MHAQIEAVDCWEIDSMHTPYQEFWWRLCKNRFNFESSKPYLYFYKEHSGKQEIIRVHAKQWTSTISWQNICRVNKMGFWSSDPVVIKKRRKRLKPTKQGEKALLDKKRNSICFCHKTGKGSSSSIPSYKIMLWNTSHIVTFTHLRTIVVHLETTTAVGISPCPWQNWPKHTFSSLFQNSRMHHFYFHSLLSNLGVFTPVSMWMHLNCCLAHLLYIS